MKNNQHKNGYAMLVVLIVIAIILILSATQMKSLFVPNVPQSHTNIEQRPWMLEELLVPAEETVKLPRSPKPELNEAFAVEAAVSRDDTDRGSITIGFKTSGRIQDKWKTRYTQNDKTYGITAEMDGNIVVKRRWEENGNTDKSRLFFIAKGPYQKQTTAVGVPEEEGTAWVIGWLQPDHSTEGHITLTTDRKWSAVYEFATSPAEE